MPIPEIVENFIGAVNRITLGATSADGGTRSSTVTLGGASNVVYGGSFSDAGEKPVIAMDVLDTHGSISVGKSASIIITKPISSLAYIPYSFTGDIIDKVILNGKLVFELN